MNTLLRPAISLMNSLRFTGKFLLMLVVLFVAIAVLVTSLYRNLDALIDASQLEINGIEVVKPLLQTVQMTQQHRGLSAAVLNGNAGMADKRQAKGSEVSQLLSAASTALPR